MHGSIQVRMGMGAHTIAQLRRFWPGRDIFSRHYWDYTAWDADRHAMLTGMKYCMM
jgi:hypothetical protein